MNSVMFTDRNQLWQELKSSAENRWDVIVVGGGITGAGILRESVRRGYRTLLIEQRDFAWGSSSRSSKMVHGGLRYLAAGKVALTRHALHERENLIAEAPRLVERLGYYFPLYLKRFPPRFMAGILFWLYDRLAGIRNHRQVSNQELKQVFTRMDTSNINGAFYYTDAVTDDARLTLRVMQESIKQGGHVRNYTRATSLLNAGERVQGLTAEDLETGESIELQARVVINATGAWADRLGNAALAGMKIRPQRGSHLILGADRFPVPHAIFLLHPEDGRRLFIYPWEGLTIVGTTDIYHPEDLDIAASMTPDELRYLLTAARQLFPENPPTRDDVISTWSGVRPIITSGKSGDPSKASREHQVWVEPGMVSCSGGKLTTFHHMALDVLSKAEPFLPPAAPFSSKRIFSDPAVEGSEIMPEDPDRGERLLGRYGENAAALLASAPASERATIAGTLTCLAQVRWALLHEAVLHLDDLMLRRTRLGILIKNGGAGILDQIKPLCREVLGWTEEKWDFEVQRYLQIIDRYYMVPAAI
ncbi:MAG: glycerol-3-phosphate dehydrogenase/oxidase [Xanthomonadales bacterium]|nr:glycerol-3-phosphate dehydrogenase/oxidase [Gammaproteobacteria bacterium]MBT8053174.1 glycerol-3-phosphate dehydrogenase/oxidase [Gammaproteobacteria bacterium]NND56082.1 glycerol-3-phosphate dehydrogenase/oxidase [Xanthomonadales bacterium]NNK50213.1 glycerol-3-phosphate dehydrogenase/oxidase [Xanthomonadales bacterium]